MVMNIINSRHCVEGRQLKFKPTRSIRMASHAISRPCAPMPLSLPLFPPSHLHYIDHVCCRVVVILFLSFYYLYYYLYYSLYHYLIIILFIIMCIIITYFYFIDLPHTYSLNYSSVYYQSFLFCLLSFVPLLINA